MKRVVVALLCLLLENTQYVDTGAGGSSSSSSSSSSYQSTSSVPPLAESYSEGACVIPQTSRKLDPKWVVRQSTFYVPIASQFTFRLYSETFLSRAGVSDQDVRSMCLTVDFFPDGPGVNLTNTGYDLREFKLTCPVIWRGQFTCLPVGGSPGTNSARARSTDNYVVSVDNQSYMLIARCVDGFFKDYMLLTTRPVVSPELYHTVVTTIKELGFDDRKMQVLGYDTCLRSDRFVTAVNVHHHHSHHHHHVGVTSGGGGATSLTVSRGQQGSVLRPSYNSNNHQQHNHHHNSHHHGGGGGSISSSGGGGGVGGRRIMISSSPPGGIPGGSHQRHHHHQQQQQNHGYGGGRGEQLEAFYAIIP